jgi:hypothetical protein
MIGAPFHYTPTGKSVSHACPADTRFFVADPGNPVSTTFVARTRYSDILIADLPPNKEFSRIYTTPLFERISSVSGLPHQPWYLVTLIRFGDGIDDRSSTRSIFIDFQDGTAHEFPLSTRTFDWQIARWACAPDSPNFGFIFCSLDGVIQLFELTYDRSLLNFKVSPRGYFRAHICRTGFLGKRDPPALFCYNPETGQPSIGESYPLPPNLPITLRADVRIFFRDRFQAVSLFSRTHRVLIYATNRLMTIVVPLSRQYMTINVDYLDLRLPPGLVRVGGKGLRIGYDPAEAPYQPISNLPFAFQREGFVLVGAPLGWVTILLLDQADRVRGAFLSELPERGTPLHWMMPLTEGADQVLVRETGDFFEFGINPRYFIDQDPRWIIPILHESFSRGITDLGSILTPAALRIYWNGEIFNEMLLLLLNQTYHEFTFGSRVCSTFCKPRFFKDFLSLFHSYSDPPKTSFTEPIYCFREFEVKAPRAFTFLPLANLSALFLKVLDLLDDPIFEIRHWSPDVQFYAWLQIFALRISLTRGPSPQSPVRAVPGIFPANCSRFITQTWSSHDLLPLAHAWPPVEARPTTKAKAARLWWHLRTHPLKMIETSAPSSQLRMFELVEQVTNQSAGEESGPLLFSLHQHLLGLDLSQPIDDF